MNAPERLPLFDVQSQPDERNVAIQAVGVKGLRYPVAIAGPREVQSTVATFSMAVGLDARRKGTHMSRFLEALQAQSDAFTPGSLRNLLRSMLAKLDAASGEIEMRFTYFVRKAAPVSGVASLVDCEVAWRAARAENEVERFSMEVAVAATSLCPCSKEISAYGAHNQRSRIVLCADLSADMAIEELVALAEASASCEVYGLLKRPDEKFVTERAYDNPKFVEDMVRDAALALAREPRVRGYCVEVENFESIHNHSAFARIEGRSHAGL